MAVVNLPKNRMNLGIQGAIIKMNQYFHILTISRNVHSFDITDKAQISSLHSLLLKPPVITTMQP